MKTKIAYIQDNLGKIIQHWFKSICWWGNVGL